MCIELAFSALASTTVSRRASILHRNRVSTHFIYHWVEKKTANRQTAPQNNISTDAECVRETDISALTGDALVETDNDSTTFMANILQSL